MKRIKDVYAIQLQKAVEYACCRYYKRVIYNFSMRIWCTTGTDMHAEEA